MGKPSESHPTMGRPYDRPITHSSKRNVATKTVVRGDLVINSGFHAARSMFDRSQTATAPAPSSDRIGSGILSSTTNDVAQRAYELAAAKQNAQEAARQSAFVSSQKPTATPPPSASYSSGLHEAPETQSAVADVSQRRPDSPGSEDDKDSEESIDMNRDVEMDGDTDVDENIDLDKGFDSDALFAAAKDLVLTSNVVVVNNVNQSPATLRISIAESDAKTSAPSATPTAVADDDAPYCSWSRVAETTEHAFPDESQTGPAPFLDLDGTPIFIGSAVLGRSVQPCKIGPGVQPSWVSVPCDGEEYFHSGRYDILPAEELQKMEWVPTAGGLIPLGRRPVVGGYDEDDKLLYHALAHFKGLEVPGKTGQHLGGARISFGNKEHEFTDNYHILCWRS